MTVEVPVGIVAEGINTVKMETRAVDPGEPPPLPVNAELKHLGKPTPRLDGPLKVTGGARYTIDIKLPGMLYAQLVTSALPHAKVKSVDTSEAEKYPGVKAVHVMERIADSKSTDAPRVRYVGQPIAAVAAVSQAIADEAARLVRVEYENLPWVVDLQKAQAPDAPLLFEQTVEQAATAGGGGGPRGCRRRGMSADPRFQNMMMSKRVWPMRM